MRLCRKCELGCALRSCCCPMLSPRRSPISCLWWKAGRPSFRSTSPWRTALRADGIEAHSCVAEMTEQIHYTASVDQGSWWPIMRAGPREISCLTRFVHRRTSWPSHRYRSSDKRPDAIRPHRGLRSSRTGGGADRSPSADQGRSTAYPAPERALMPVQLPRSLPWCRARQARPMVDGDCCPRWSD